MEGFCFPKPEVRNDTCVSTRGVVLGTQRRVLMHWRMVVESGGQQRRSMGLDLLSHQPRAEQHTVLTGREEAASAYGVPGCNAWF